MMKLKQKGDWSSTESFLKDAANPNVDHIYHKYGREGVAALALATPKASGLTSQSWDYQIRKKGDKVYIEWLNSNIQNGVNVAILLQYGHGTGTGGYVKGRNYINPALKSIFDKMADDIWREVNSK